MQTKIHFTLYPPCYLIFCRARKREKVVNLHIFISINSAKVANLWISIRFLFFSEPFPRIFVLLVLMVLTVLFICVLGVRMDCRVVFTFSNLCHVGIIYFLSPAFLRHWDYREQSRATRLTNGVRSPLACGVWMLGKFGPVYVRIGKKSSWESVFGCECVH